LMYVIVYKAYRRNTKFKRTSFYCKYADTSENKKDLWFSPSFPLSSLSLAHPFVFVKASTKLTIKPVCRHLQTWKV
jgi:hypothetical protein